MVLALRRCCARLDVWFLLHIFACLKSVPHLFILVGEVDQGSHGRDLTIQHKDMVVYAKYLLYHVVLGVGKNVLFFLGHIWIRYLNIIFLEL